MLKSMIFGTFLVCVLLSSGVVGGFKEYNYHISTNPAIWINAVEDCQAAFHPNSHLLSIESEEEMNWINAYLEKFGSGVSYWTSGRYDNTKNSKFQWAAHEKGVPAAAPWFNWAPNNPPELESMTQRIAISHKSQLDSTFEVFANTLQRRYICEVTDFNATIVEPCYETNDLYIVLDASGSITPADYDLAKEFIANLVSAFIVHDQNRIGMSTFSTSVYPVFPLDFVGDGDILKATILGAGHSQGGTSTDLALDYAVGQTVPLRRTGIPQNVLVLTDGMSNDRPLTIAAAQRALAAGLEMFAVGIGNYDVDELKEISGFRPDRLFTVDQFNELVQLLRTTSRRICPDYK